MHTLEGIVLIQSSLTFVRMFVLMESGQNKKKVMLGQKLGH